MAAVPRVGAQQIEMEVVGVVGVAARTEHRVELGASPGEGRLQEGPFRRTAPATNRATR